MEQVLKTGDIIELDERDYYYVVAKVVYKGEEYADIVKYPEDPKDYLHEERLLRKVVKVDIRDEGVFINNVEDKDIIARVRKAAETKIKPVKKVKKAQ